MFLLFFKKLIFSYFCLRTDNFFHILTTIVLFFAYRVVGTADVKPVKHAVAATLHDIAGLSVSTRIGNITIMYVGRTPLQLQPLLVMILVRANLKLLPLSCHLL